MNPSKHPSLMFLADGRSATALNWVRYFIQAGYPVHFVSSFPCTPPEGAASFQVIPLAFAEAAGSNPAAKSGSWVRRWVPPGLRTKIRQWAGPFTLLRAARQLEKAIQARKPDLLHAMRIPYEGMTAGLAKITIPWLVSVWGNDFTLHAPSSPLMGYLTRKTLQNASALHADCQRDIHLAKNWGFNLALPNVVLPGGGGIQTEWFHPADIEPGPVVINPRGLRAYVRNDTFFKSIPLVLEKAPAARFIGSAMQGETEAEQWVRKLNIADSVALMPKVSREEMVKQFQQARVVVSPSVHDGTPNTLLEAMACGCFPVAGDIESIREWLVDGQNGLLVDPTDPQALADAVLRALENETLRRQAAIINQDLIASRAAYEPVMEQAERFYKGLTA